MSAGLTATFQFLAKTENKAAVEVLVAGLDCPHKPIRHGALRAVLDRRCPEGHREVFRRLSSMDERSREIINERPERLAGVVTDALQNATSQACAAACNAIVSFRLCEALPVLVSVLVDPENPHTKMVAETVLELTESFYAELSGTTEGPKHKRQDLVRDRITAALEAGVRKFRRHKQTAAVEAFLLIAKQKNIVLRQLLQRPEEASHQPLVELLSSSSRGGVIRLLLGFLEDPQMPHVVAQVLCNRCDAKFVDHLVRTVGPRPSKTVVETLARFNSIAWAQPGHELFDKLSNAAQQGAVPLLMASSIDRAKLLEIIGYLLLEGKPGGRRAAAEALAEFPGPEASALVVKALGDEDARIRASLIVQLRPRKIPGAFSLLIRMIDSPQEEVQRALQKALPEFTFHQFLANFDKMPEHWQPIAGYMVRNIDPKVADKLVAELNGLSPVRRRRAVTAAGVMGLVPKVEETIVRQLSDEDHMVRVAAAKILAESKSKPTWEALRDALLDKSFAVKEAAEQSLERISRSLAQQTEQIEQQRRPQDNPEEVAP